MIKFALTGNIASGKSCVEKFLNDNGFEVFDTDRLTHEILNNEAFNLVVTEFGKEILTDNKIDRKKLGEIVFSDYKKRKALENIIHPVIKEKINAYFEDNKQEKVVIVAVPLLFEANMDDMFDKIILVVADDELRLERLMKRNNLSREDAIMRIKSQLSQFAKLEDSDYVFHNNAGIENLKNQVNDFCDKILKD